jgi:hypothetical protein
MKLREVEPMQRVRRIVGESTGRSVTQSLPVHSQLAWTLAPV